MIVSNKKIMKKITLLLLITASFFEIISQYSKQPFERKVFIENKGQFNNELPIEYQNFEYCIDNGTQILFKNNELIYHFTKEHNDEWLEEERREAENGGFKSDEEEQREREKFKPTHEYIKLKWLNANPDAKIEVLDVADAKYGYGIDWKETKKGYTVFCQGYKKIIIKELYNGVDAEYFFTENSGEVKYNLIVKPLADVGQIKFKYEGVDASLVNGKLSFQTSVGSLFENAPISYLLNGKKEVNSSFEVSSEGIISFFVENKGEAVIIDPLIAVPGLGGAIPVDNGVDALGNHYVTSAGFILEKYTPTGVMEFSVVTGSGLFGDMLTSSTGDCYFNAVIGVNSIAYDASGNFLWSSGGIAECWRFVLNECYGQVYSLTGKRHSVSGFATIDVATGTLLNYDGGGNCCYDPHSGIVDNDGSVFTVASNPGTIHHWSPTNVSLATYPSPIPFGYASGYAGMQGYNGMAHLGDFLYLHNGATIAKVSKLDGSVAGTLVVPNGAKGNCGGIFVTSCGYLLIGSTDGVYLYDSNFGQIDFRGTPGAVYDLAYNEFNQNFAVCGPNHISEVDFNLPPCIFQTNPVVIPSCNDLDNGGIKLNLSGGVPNYIYTWYDGNGNLLPAYTADSIAELPIGTYKCVYSDNRCPIPLIDSVEVTVGVQTLIPLFTSENVCLGVSTEFENNSTTSIGSITSIEWDFGDLNSSLLANPTHLYSLVGTYNVKLVVEASHAYGCKDSIDANAIAVDNVFVYPIPEASFTSVKECNTIAVQFTSNSNISAGVISDYVWNFDDNESSLDTNPQHLFPLDRFPFLNNYNVKLTVTSDQGCIDDTLINYEPYPMPLTLFSAPNTCVNQSIQFTNLSTIVAPDVLNPIIYNFGDGSGLINTNNPIYTYTTAGTFQVSAIATSNNGCIKDTTINIEIYPEPVANFTSTDVCENAPYTSFSNLSTILSGTIMLNNWSFGDGNTSAFPNPNHNYSTSGAYNAFLTVVSDNNCENTITLPVEVKAKPSSKFVVASPEGCDEHCVEFLNTSVANATSIVNTEWVFSNGESNVELSPIVCFSNKSNTVDSSYSVTLYVQNDLGCIDTLVRENYITVYHNPVAIFTPTTLEENMYESEFKMINQSIGADGYIWDLGDSSRSEEFEPIHVYSDTGIYYITLVSYTLNNCMDTTKNSIRVTPVISVFIPNTFSPNGDDVNDVFKFEGYGIVTEDFEFSVFDRWGTKLYYTNQIDLGWDGRYKGTMSQQDTYLYRLSCTDSFGEVHEFKGHVNLIK